MVAARDCCRSAAARSLLVSSQRLSSSRAARWSKPSDSMRAAASSIASGIPSSLATICATSGRVRSSRQNHRSASRARSANRVTASLPAARGCSRYFASPATLSGSLLVASTCTSSAESSNARHSSAAAPSRCSQLSRTKSSWRRASAVQSESIGDSEGFCGSPMMAATVAGTSEPSWTAPSSTSQAPSANRQPTVRATSPANRVLPTPPTPATVTIRCALSRSATSAASTTRPTKLVSGAVKPCIPPLPPTARS